MEVSPLREISSRPSAPCTTSARWTPNSPRAWATSSVRLASYTPTICAEAPAGLVSGPSRLNTVRTRNSRRAGMAGASGRGPVFHAGGSEPVGGAEARACGAIAVFRDAHACAGDYESDRGGNVECAARVAAGAAGVHNHFVGMFAADGENWRHVAAHGESEADDFVHRFALDAQSDQQGGDLFGAGVAGKDLLHRGLGFGAREIFAFD